MFRQSGHDIGVFSIGRSYVQCYFTTVSVSAITFVINNCRGVFCWSFGSHAVRIALTFDATASYRFPIYVFGCTHLSILPLTSVVREPGISPFFLSQKEYET